MNYFSFKPIQTTSVIISFIVLSASFYMQFVNGFQPCPLCIMQRLCVFLVLLFSVLSFGLSGGLKKKNMVIAQLFFACAGLFFASRHLWIQSLPASDVHACVPGLDILFRYFPWQDLAHALFWGSGDCTQISWRFIGLSMPAWSALYFLFICISTSTLLFVIKPDFSASNP